MDLSKFGNNRIHGWIIIILMVLGATVILRNLTPKSAGVLSFVEAFAPFLASSASIARNLDRDDDLARESLGILTDRGYAGAREQAVDLLNSDDDYVWFNAALYLGKLRDSRSIPYLIKGLSHPAWRTRDEVASYLLALTGQDFGTDQPAWIQWWQRTRPDSQFRFTYEDPKPIISREQSYLMNEVIDPVTIGHLGTRVRLVGIRLREGSSPEDAVVYLKGLVLDQYFEFELAARDAPDRNGVYHALAYWLFSSDPDPLLRRGLPAVPFQERTLLNTYLIESPYYEADLESVGDQRTRSLLQDQVSGDDP